MDFFKLKERNSSVKTEAKAGFTTFLTMLYIVPVNAAILSQAGMPLEALVTATALITIIASVFNGFWSNTPIAMSTGMGLNAYFSFVLVGQLGIPWQSALGIVFISGMIFLVLSFTKFRSWMINSISEDLRRAISAGIGAFIAFIGLQQMGIIANNDATLVALGNLREPNVALGLFGLAVVIVFFIWKVKGAFILAILSTSIVAWAFGIVPPPNEIFSLPASVAPIAFELDVLSALKLAFIPAIITFFVTDLFDTLGTLAGVGFRAGLFKKGSVELEKTLEADAAASVASSLLGVSTTTSFVESASGVEEGGRSGLTAIFAGLFFIFTLFMLPLFKAIPLNAIYPVLVMVGVLMFAELVNINFKDKSVAIATFLIVIMMPLTYSITYGLAFGFVSYTITKLLTKEFKDINVGVIFLFIISLLAFVVH
ncbi:MAG: NCS2 family permease [Campylobacteraceae bacterium]|jgi:AGZA family xanthine/uracil permease-like MFS transporter|nr:NCS2 family permease [Campylobacteraceae bacterium]